MQRTRQRSASWTTWACVAAAAALLSACGGGGDSSEDPNKITTVKVLGDSLADSGTFGYKFTVQSAQPTGTGSTPLWVDQIATKYNTSLCAHYRYTGTGFGTQASCTNYAIGGARINYAQSPNAPLSILQQLKDAGAAGYSANDLLLIDGGGNDASDLVSAYLAASVDKGASYAALLSTQLDASMVQSLLGAGPTGQAELGIHYMQALAKNWAAAIRSQTVANGATRVAVLNMPDITLTPKLGVVLQAVAAQQGQATAQQLQSLVSTWVQAFNKQLASSLGGDTRITVVDFYGALNDQVTQPQKYGYTNATTPACPIKSLDAQGLPSYDLSTCTAAGLSASIPAGQTSATWWQSYVFADSFHPTPRGHEQLGSAVAARLTQSGW